MNLDMGKEDKTPIILGRLFLSTTKAIIYNGTDQVHFHFPGEKVHSYFIDYNSSRLLAFTRTKKRSQQHALRIKVEGEKAKEKYTTPEEHP